MLSYSNMKVYTKTGDLGETSLFGGKRVNKTHEILDVLGTLDELNATLGLLSTSRTPEVKAPVLEVQNDIFTLGAYIANPKTTVAQYKILAEKTQTLEARIDNLEQKLPELKNFILPIGAHSAVYLHLARAMTRRLERSLVSYYNTSDDIKGREYVLPYINRLSDFLFVLARFANQKLGVQDYIWKGLND